jgi:Tol biopolymer transport system component
MEDGSQIVFGWSPQSGDAMPDCKGFDLYVKSADSENLHRLSNQPSQWISSAWSPDGKQIAFQRVTKDDTGLYLIPSEGGPERKLHATHISLPGASRISWSADGKSIAFAESPGPSGHRRLHLLRLEP